MSESGPIVNFSEVSEMLHGDDAFIKEFSQAAVSSFSDFKRDYEQYLLARDEENLRKAGHKIKPVAKMLGVDQVVDEYEHAKQLLWDEKPDEELQQSVDKVNAICSKVLDELNDKIS